MSSGMSSFVNCTPTRERHSSSQSTSSPVSLRPPASSSTSSLAASTSTTSATNSTAYPITLEALLAHHANAPNPTLAALDQALSERNVFSTQNTQLWKLIEKQRSGYNQVLKELERIRADRDAYKARLQAAGLSVEPGKKDKDKSKPLRTFASNAAISTAVMNGSADPRAGMLCHQPDTSAPSSRNDDRPVTPPRLQDANGRGFQTPQSQGPYNTVMSPLIVPPRSASLPQGSSSAASTPSHSPALASFSEATSLNEGDKASLTRITPSVDSIPGSAPPQVRSSQQSHGTTPSSLPYDGNGGSGSHPQPPQNHFMASHINTVVPPQTSALSPYSTALSAQSTAHGTHPASLMPHGPSSGMLSPIIEDPRQLSRESRVSLPDEGKRYIANMGDSPVPSARVHGFAASTSVPGQGQAQAQIIHSADAVGRSSPSKLDRTASARGEDDGEFLDMDENEDRENEQQRQPSSSSAIKKKDKPRANVDDFPMPPSHGPLQVPQTTHVQGAQVLPNPMLTPTQANLRPSAVLDAGTTSQTHWQSEVFPQSQSSLDLTPSMPVPESPLPESYLSPTKTTHGSLSAGPSPIFRALPLVADDLRTTRLTVSHSSIKPNDRGKEVLSFEIEVDPGNAKEPWKVQKLYSDVLGLDHRLRAVVGKGVSKKIAALPEGKLWRDHAPAKSDQRKAALEVYLQSLINLPIKNKDEVIAFFTTDILRDTKKPVMQAGYKEGYLTKRGKNFGGWKTRYFVLQGPVLEYYESRGGAHLGSIVITNAQIGRQQRTVDDDEKNYRHAFLIIEAKKGPSGSNPRHVLCAESDSERDSWVDILVRYVTGTFNEDSLPFVSTAPSPIFVNVSQTQSIGSAQPRSSTSSNQDAVATPNGKRTMRAMSKDDSSRGAAVPVSQLAPDANHANFFQYPGSVSIDESYSASPTKSVHTATTEWDQSTAEENARRLMERGGSAEPPLSSSLPTTSPLEGAGQGLVAFRSSSELGHYTDMDRRGAYPKQEQTTPELGRSREGRRDRKSYHPGLTAVSGSPTTATFPERAPSPDVSSTPLRGGDPNGKVKISGPLSGAPIPAGYKFGGKDVPAEVTFSSDRREKAKSRSFWNFGRPTDKPVASTPRAVFGVSLDESLEVAEIACLPAVVFRCIQYLEAKKAEQEEGIYRLSGSSAVIKGLKDRFNAEGDVDLLGSDEYWDPHAIAGLLKSFLRELPASILTRDLHMKFLSVMDFVEPQERIRELSHLIASLPIANYSLLRALTAHLILIVQNSAINKMTMRNVGIVFSPTLGIPAGVFSLMLGEFNRVFNVDAANDTLEGDTDNEGEPSRRNSRQYSDAAADKLLGLSGRTLYAPEDNPSEDGDSLSIQYDSGSETTENDATMESGQTRSSNPSQHHSSQQSTELLSPARPDFPSTESRSRASNVAASRGLNIAVNKKSNRHSRMIGLPMSPRPPTDTPHSPVPSPLHTAKQS
ncbi:RhoGAP-domain-containing protein [Gyrodon lividus]|nr:RhoGAP-domain-containing protein [Gyrodon lividus]